MLELKLLSLFICPVCKKSLCEEKKAYRCENGHSFDRSAQGYVNLMPSGKSNGNAGDNAEMMFARTNFLNAEYYACLKNAIVKAVTEDIIEKADDESPLVIDAGCGEGYYTSAVAKSLEKAVPKAQIAGIDVSKRGIKAAAKRGGSVRYAVAGIFDMPFSSESVSLAMSIFAPIAPSEFLRVLKKGGSLLVASPGKNHLLGLKKAVYDKPYLNEEKPFCPDGFEIAKKIEVKEDITVLGENIKNLFMMTPYFFHTPLEEAKRLDGLQKLETPVEFIITKLTKL